MTTYDHDDVDENGWCAFFPTTSRMKLRCCDCDLVHDLELRRIRGRIMMRARRNARATAACRRTDRKTTPAMTATLKPSPSALREADPETCPLCETARHNPLTSIVDQACRGCRVRYTSNLPRGGRERMAEFVAFTEGLGAVEQWVADVAAEYQRRQAWRDAKGAA